MDAPRVLARFVEEEVRAMCRRDSRAPGKSQLSFGRHEDRHRQHVFEVRCDGVEVAARADQHQGFGLPVGLREYRAQPARKILVGGDGMVDGRLHRAISRIDHQDDDGIGLDDAHRGDLVADDAGDSAGQGFGGLRQSHRDHIVETRFRQRLQQQ